jgi:peptidoglycan/LPS O-acetylase OafA/YrhL
MELLRIIAMFMVLVLHSNFAAVGEPTCDIINNNPFSQSLSVLTESFAVVAVDVFILISGWFGIHSSVKGFGNFVFIVIFYKS